MTGDAAPGALPSGVVTFLFTDIEGSTRRWEVDPEVMRAALADHDEVLRTAIEGQGGRIFKHTGDGACAVFSSPRAAVQAAVAAQQALELPVRMGISTGEAELRGSDYFGAVLNRVARVMAAGHGGQVLLDGVAASLLNGVDVADLGARRLRDIMQPVQIFQVRVPGLRGEFPPLRTDDPRPGNLRPATTRIIGRDAEIDQLQAAVKFHRLVTLTGAGGVGKTRLAVEVAARLAAQFPDGVWFFGLAAVTDPEAVPDSVAGVLGIIQQPGKTVTESVAAALEGRARLLVLDNCEHVLDAAADMVEAILAASTTVTVLATSREGLGLPDEQQWRVPSLDVRSGPESAAVTLFVDRARMVSDFELDQPGQAEAVVEICRRLDGIPLAIELAASRMAAMTAGEVRDRLHDRFRLLVGSRRSLSRHQTLRHAVAWSYDLLGDDEKALFERCSVFMDGFDLDSAAAVAGSDDEIVTLGLLDLLVRKSLLVTDRSSGHTRYSMLETIRQFAEDQLVAGGQAPEARGRHARYFAGRAIEIMAVWDSARQQDAYEWLRCELANLRAAFRWARDNDDLDTASAIAAWAAWLGVLTQSFEPIAWAEELVEPLTAVDHPRLPLTLIDAAQCFMQGRVVDAVRYAEAGQRLMGNEGKTAPFGGIEAAIAVVFTVIGEPQRCIDWCRTLIAQGHDSYGFAGTVLTMTLALTGREEEARSAAIGLHDTAAFAHNPWALSQTLLARGFALRGVDRARALEAIRRGLTVAQASGNSHVESMALAGLSRVETEDDDPLAALEHFTLVIRNYHDTGNIGLISSPLASLAALLHRLKRYAPAAILAGFAVNPFTSATVPELTPVMEHLRHVLGEQKYETLAREGKAMTTAEVVAYAYGQIDQARTELTIVSE